MRQNPFRNFFKKKCFKTFEKAALKLCYRFDPPERLGFTLKKSLANQKIC